MEVTIPNGMQPGGKITLPNKGIPRVGQMEFRGNQVVTVNVEFPTSLTSKEKTTLEALRELQEQIPGRTNKKASNNSSSSEGPNSSSDNKNNGKKGSGWGFFK